MYQNSNPVGKNNVLTRGSQANSFGEENVHSTEISKQISIDEDQNISGVPDEASVNKNIQQSKQRPSSLKMAIGNINTTGVIK